MKDIFYENKHNEAKRRKLIQQQMARQAKELATEMVIDYANRPIPTETIDFYVPHDKIDDPKLKVSQKVEIDPKTYKVEYLDPAKQDIRHVTLINGIIQPVILDDGQILDGQTPLIPVHPVPYEEPIEVEVVEGEPDEDSDEVIYEADIPEPCPAESDPPKKEEKPQPIQRQPAPEPAPVDLSGL